MTVSSFGFARGNVAKLLAFPRYGAGWLRSHTVRRDPQQWVVGSAFGVADGALAFVRAALELPAPPRIIWLSGSEQEAAQARELGVADVIDRDSPAGLHATLGAGLAVVTHGFGDVNRYGLSGAVIVQLWHGAPLKKLHADSPAVTSLGGLERLPGASALMRWAYRRGTSRISLLPTGSSYFVASLCSAFTLTPRQVQVTGEPRADVLFTGGTAQRIADARALLAPHLGGHTDATVVLYAPTWRDGEPDPGVPTEDEWERLDEFCEANDVVLLVRPHRLAVGEYNHSSSRVRLLTSRELADSMAVLWAVDVLISDYSSMVVDFAATGHHILLLAPDLESYTRTRGLYIDYGWLAGGSWSSTWTQLIDRLDALLNDADAADASAEHTRMLADTFHAHTDGRNAARVVSVALDLVHARFTRTRRRREP
jgi:Putative glycosyl/glycerophosphate transferases involved in teichoic acid biosynthesis TagF/TagB/EpsJ/RodC